MYKRTVHYSAKSLSFSPEIQSVVNSFVDRFLDELEFTLLEGYSDPLCTLNKGEKEQEILKKYFSCYFKGFSDCWSLSLHMNQTLELLDALLSEKLDSLMIIEKPLSELGDTTVDKNRNREPKISFEEYIKERDVKNLGKHKLNVIADFKLLAEASYAHRPKYFLLYRLRNNILRHMNKRSYSIQSMTNLIKNLRDAFEVLLYKWVIQNNVDQLSTNDLEDVFLEIEEELLDDYLTQYRLGKTEEEGRKIAQEVQLKLESFRVQEQVRGKTLLFYCLFNDYNEEKITTWIRAYIETFNTFTSQAVGDIEKKIPRYTAIKLMDHLRLRLVGKILKSSSDDNLFGTTYLSIDTITKSVLAHEIFDKFLTNATYNVYFNVDDLINSKQIKQIDFHGVTILSDEEFAERQNEWYKESTQRIVVSSGDSKTVWIAIEDIEAGYNDVDMAVVLGLKRVHRFLNMLYHFISREDEINYKISPRCLVVNVTRETNTLKYLSAPSGEPKDIDSINRELTDFISLQLESKDKWREAVSESVTLYTQLIKCEDIHKKIRLIKSVLDTLFPDTNAALFSSILVAGTNIDRYNVTYKEARNWLYEDYQELVYLASRDEEYAALKERIYERFKVFTKIVIRTLWFNLARAKTNGVNAYDVVNWILFMHPDDEIIKGGVCDE